MAYEQEPNLSPEQRSEGNVILDPFGLRGTRLTAEEVAGVQARFMTHVYTWMAVGLALTGAMALFMSMTPALANLVLGNRFGFFGLMIVELLVVGYLSARIFTMSVQQAIGAFVGYAVLNGLTLGIIFLVYTSDSIASTFFTTAGTFGVMSAFGYFTGTDLSRWGNLLFMGLIGIVIASVVNIFWLNDTFSFVISVLGVLLFVALTAYDTQKVKQMAFIGFEEDGTDLSAMSQKASILGALTLYLDFINLFLFLLRLFGRRK